MKIAYWVAEPFVELNNLCYNVEVMNDYSVSPDQTSIPPEVEAPDDVTSDQPELSPAELRAQRLLRWGLVIVAVLLASIIVLLVFLSVNAYQATFAGVGPTPGEVVVSLLRDAAIIFVAFETLVIGALLIILTIQVQSLVVLLRDEIGPMLEALNETVATVRGTTKFVSHNVVSPVMKWSGYLAGLRRMAQELTSLVSGEDKAQNEDLE